MSHEDIIEDEKAEYQHSNEVLASFEAQLILLKKWLEHPMNYPKEDECDKEFQVLHKGLEKN